jgi:8-oxo-dGTP pyrophosphatase MutT (NUDIX family)
MSENKMKIWKTIETNNILKAHVFRYLQVKRESPTTNQVGEFDIVQCSNWVNVMAITPEKKIILIKQFRHGTNNYTIEIPGGAVNHNEDPLIGAQRELEEETGYTSTNWKLLGKVDVNPAFMTNACVTYLALDAVKTKEQNLDPFEEIDVFLQDLKDIPGMVASGEITHSLVITAFYLYSLLPTLA